MPFLAIVDCETKVPPEVCERPAQPSAPYRDDRPVLAVGSVGALSTALSIALTYALIAADSSASLSCSGSRRSRRVERLVGVDVADAVGVRDEGGRLDGQLHHRVDAAVGDRAEGVVALDAGLAGILDCDLPLLLDLADLGALVADHGVEVCGVVQVLLRLHEPFM